MEKLSVGRKALHIFAVLTALCTFILLASGGLVTSKGVGLAVPDWPSTFGYNMFLFPPSRWLGGVFYEHTHRLIASGVGFLTLILAAGVFAFDPRRWMKVLASCAVVSVIIQGVLGGLRVTMLKDEIGIFHGMLAQSFFCLLGVMAVSTSAAFVRGEWAPQIACRPVRNGVLALTVAVFIQLGLGATMRHEHAGLSIFDFPLAYGRIIPDTSPEAIQTINAERQQLGEKPTNAVFIWVQMVHRGVALAILLLAVLAAIKALRSPELPGSIARTAWLIVGMVAAQVGLGAWTIWSNKAADVATAHMALGALTLFVCARLSYRLVVMDARQERLEVPASSAYSRASA